jgi:hypothetical protein
MVAFFGSSAAALPKEQAGAPGRIDVPHVLRLHARRGNIPACLQRLKVLPELRTSLARENSSVARRESTALHDSHVIDALPRLRVALLNVVNPAYFGEPRRLTSTAAPTQTNIVCKMKAGHATA